MSTSIPSTQSAGATFGQLRRHRGDDDPATIEARRALAAAKIADAIEREVAEAPPLTADQAARLSGLLHGGAR